MVGLDLWSGLWHAPAVADRTEICTYLTTTHARLRTSSASVIITRVADDGRCYIKHRHIQIIGRPSIRFVYKLAWLALDVELHSNNSSSFLLLHTTSLFTPSFESRRQCSHSSLSLPLFSSSSLSPRLLPWSSSTDLNSTFSSPPLSSQIPERLG